jgi:anti-sigma-K factor RskA
MSGGTGRTSLSELAADHALGLAEGAELERAQRLMETDTAFRAEVEALRRSLAELDATAPEPAPGPEAWRRIEAALDAPPPPAAVTRRAGFWESLSFWRPAALGAAAAALLLAVGLGAALLRPPAQPIFVAVLQTDEGRAQAVVNAYADGTVTLVPIEQIGIPQGRIIEVWTLQSREQGPISIGRMDQARTLKLDLSRLRRPDAGHLFEMTVEPPGGSPTGRPTGPVLSKGLAGQAL